MKIITGMHRSGTSLTSNFLMKISGQSNSSDEKINSDQWNPKGYFENAEVVVLNNTILLGKFAPSSQILKDPALSNKKLKKAFLSIANLNYLLVLLNPNRVDRRAYKYRNEIAALSHKYQDAIVKDPRFSLLLASWQKWGAIQKTLVCFRDPKEVAESLKQRNHVPLFIGYWLWKFHNTRLLDAINQCGDDQINVIQYNNFFDPQKREGEIKRLYAFLEIAYDAEQAKNLLDNILDENLKHHTNASCNYPPDVNAILTRLTLLHDRPV